MHACREQSDDQIDQAAGTRPPDFDRTESGAGHRVDRGPHGRRHPKCPDIERGFLWAGPVHFRRKDVDMTLLERTDHHTYCPYKGDCAYFSIPLGAERSVNAVWTYEAPYAGRRRDQGPRCLLSASSRRDRRAQLSAPIDAVMAEGSPEFADESAFDQLRVCWGMNARIGHVARAARLGCAAAGS